MVKAPWMAGSRPTPRSPGRRVAAEVAAAVLLLVAVGACSSEITFPREGEPIVYLVLNQVAPAGAGDVKQTAFVLRQIRADSAVFLEAQRFEMRRVSDGASFDWRHGGIFGSVPFSETGGALQTGEGNYVLADSATESGLGRAELEPGTAYSLRVVTDQAEITGTVTMPDSFSITRAGSGEVRRAVWPDVEGAGGYSVQTFFGEEQDVRLQRDTAVSVPAGPGSIFVRALDPQAFRYVSDPDARRAGIEGGLGVLGAIQVERREFAGS